MAGEEVLIADGNERDREQLAVFMESKGLVPSVVGSYLAGRDKVAGKFFALVLVDLDLPGGGIDLLEFTRERSPATQRIALTPRKNFDTAVGAFRSGVLDVVIKRPEEQYALEAAIESGLTRYRTTQGAGLRPVGDALNELVKTVIAFGREAYKGDIDSMTAVARAAIHVLLVDDDTSFLAEISEELQGLEMEAFVEMSGGGALDRIGALRFDIVAVKEGLMDLPGALVVSAAQQRNPECTALVYGYAGPQGRIERMVDGRTEEAYPFKQNRDVGARVRQLVEDEALRRRERRVLQVVSSKHADVLRKYGEARRIIEELSKSG